jgi:hypothetical protein
MSPSSLMRSTTSRNSELHPLHHRRLPLHESPTARVSAAAIRQGTTADTMVDRYPATMISGRCTWGQAVPCLASRVIGVPLQMSSVLQQGLTVLMVVAGARGHEEDGSRLTAASPYSGGTNA